MPSIIFSALDPAGSNAARLLVSEKKFSEADGATIAGKTFRSWKRSGSALIEINSRLIESDFLSELRTDLIVFASKHKSESAKPCLTVHSTGNWGAPEAGFGGNARELGLTSAKAKKTAFEFLRQRALPGFEVVMEATHHGPTALATPSVFVEVGSSEKEWNNEEAVRLLAECVLFVCENYSSAKGKTVLGFGGNHYCAKFNGLEAGGYAFSHVAAKHSLDFIDAALVEQAIAKTSERIEGAVIDWKGCGSEQRTRVIKALEENGLGWEKA